MASKNFCILWLDKPQKLLQYPPIETDNQPGDDEMTKLLRTLEIDRGPGRLPKRVPVVECTCGHVVECHGSWANECDHCGTEFNGSGQRLAPRSHWGEETGEYFAAEYDY
jgi:hypothetical protein